MLAWIMTKNCAILTLIMLIFFVTNCESVCVNAGTSEGFVTLLEGQRACAPLQSDETESDKGKRFVTCIHDSIFTQMCPSGLRFDTTTSNCNWPQAATCQLDGVNPETTSTIISKTPQDTVTPAATVTPSEEPPGNTIESTKTTQQPVFTKPTTIRPTQPPPTGPCNSDTCKLPNCVCYGASPNMPIKDTPMFIMLTFDDAVTTTVYNGFFKSLLVDNSNNIINPNGCPIRAAFYVNDLYTDYSFVKSLADKGNEIASHTVNHSLPQGDSDGDYREAVDEIVGMREKVLRGTGNKTISDSMIGFRSPYLKVAHNTQFDALRDTGFLYDTSITNIETTSGRPPLWPYTLDYVMPRCTNLPCPTKPYPGFWEVPINGWVGSTGYGCSMIDVCSVGTNVFTASEEEWTEFYKNNFDNYFYPVRVPMHMFTHGSMFLRSPPSYPALIKWFQELQLTHSDVWIVTPKMVIEWMKNPLTNSQMIAQNWGC